jgi:hypothetical protein
MKAPLPALRPGHDESDTAYQRVMDSGSDALGKENEQFDAEFAAARNCVR